MQLLITVCALIEISIGLALLTVPSLVASLLLGTSLDTAAGVGLGRIAGAALVALGVACLYARVDTRSRAASGVVMAMLIYNIAATVVLVNLRFGVGMTGAGLLPAAALHAAMAVWCVYFARKRRPVGGQMDAA